jgi:two-component system, chemotaxis family, CheB/CheR fusion protein
VIDTIDAEGIPHLPDESDDVSFDALIRYIQESRGIDFRGYKRTSLRRRVTLRMEQVGADGFAAYHAVLEADPQEFGALLNTILINVTSFFRDPDAWEAIKQNVVPKLLVSVLRGQVRIWSVGCASGEEPYSLAMLFAEALGAGEFARRVKIYATDLDEAALDTARHAAYLPRQVESVPDALLHKYFERTDSHYLVNRELRKCVIFGRHNIVDDAPISRIDLLACRNLLIYLATDTQNMVLPRLHYALADTGVLFLGKAETQLARSKLFQALDMKHRLFQKVPQGWRRVAGGGIMSGGERNNGGVLPQNGLLDAIIDNAISAYLAIDTNGIVVFANALARRMLEVGEADVGRAFQDLSISYRPVELRSRIDEAHRQGRPVRIEHQAYHRPPADPIRLTIDVAPLATRDGQVIATLLTFTDTTRTFRLQQELEAAQESLETTIEELQSANEELETTNEELQSTNEELETTNEELQSTNEELETTNEELRSTNEQLEHTNDELRRQSAASDAYRQYAEAILRSTNSGVIVVDENQIVRSWNRWSENIWGLRGEETINHKLATLDIGLPVQQIETALQSVIAGGEAVEMQVDAVQRRGRPIHCRVRVSPLLYEDRASHGAVLFVEEFAKSERKA